MTNIALSAIDEARFGIVTAKATAAEASDIPAIAAQCRAQNVALLILRIDTAHVAAMQAAEQAGAYLADTLVYFERAIAGMGDAHLPEGVSSRLAQPADADGVAALAREIFTGYQGHYHCDPRLAADAADEVYVSWAHATCATPGVADAVLLLEDSQGLLAFCALRTTGASNVDVSLIGVAPRARRLGLFDCLLRMAAQWGAARSLDTIEYSTQITNLAAQRGLAKAGFLPAKSLYTLHHWFD
jgi:GNAT superfamily N-acetyltransferase